MYIDIDVHTQHTHIIYFLLLDDGLASCLLLLLFLLIIFFLNRIFRIFYLYFRFTHTDIVYEHMSSQQNEQCVKRSEK